MAHSLEDRRAFAEWLVTPTSTRRAHRLPDSKEAYARARGVTSRTLRRWEGEESFQRLLTEARERLAEMAVEPVLAPPAPAASLDDQMRQDYEAIRGRVLSRALEGDPKMLDVWMKMFGQTFVQEDMAARARGLADLDDDALVAETLELIGRERVATWLVDAR